MKKQKHLNEKKYEIPLKNKGKEESLSRMVIASTRSFNVRKSGGRKR